MKFEQANVKGIKADIAKGTITLSFEVDMNKDNLIMAEDELSLYAGKDSGYVDIEIHPRQLPLKEQVENSEAEAAKEGEVIDTDPGTWEQTPVGQLPSGEDTLLEEEPINDPKYAPEVDSNTPDTEPEPETETA